MVCSAAWADFSALLAIEPTERKDGLMVSRQGLETGLSKALGSTVKVTSTEDLTDALRATRSGAHDLFIAPPQVVASALGHGFELLGSTDARRAVPAGGGALRCPVRATCVARVGCTCLSKIPSTPTWRVAC